MSGSFPTGPSYRYRGRVHETIDASILAGGGGLRKTAIRIDHNFCSDLEARRRKNHWYIEILKEEIAADPSDDSRLDFLAAEYHQLGMFEEATRIAERIARVRPLDPRAHLFAGLYHLLYQPDLEQARADFNQALLLRPGLPRSDLVLAAPRSTTQLNFRNAKRRSFKYPTRTPRAMRERTYLTSASAYLFKITIFTRRLWRGPRACHWSASGDVSAKPTMIMR